MWRTDLHEALRHGAIVHAQLSSVQDHVLSAPAVSPGFPSFIPLFYSSLLFLFSSSLLLLMAALPPRCTEAQRDTWAGECCHSQRDQVTRHLPLRASGYWLQCPQRERRTRLGRTGPGSLSSCWAEPDPAHCPAAPEPGPVSLSSCWSEPGPFSLFSCFLQCEVCFKGSVHPETRRRFCSCSPNTSGEWHSVCVLRSRKWIHDSRDRFCSCWCLQK